MVDIMVACIIDFIAMCHFPYHMRHSPVADKSAPLTHGLQRRRMDKDAALAALISNATPSSVSASNLVNCIPIAALNNIE